MKLKVFAIHDAKAEAYMQPFFLANKGMAIRAVMDIFTTQRDHAINKYPEDFTLFELGEYNDLNGEMAPLPTPIPVAKAIELKTSVGESRQLGGLQTL